MDNTPAEKVITAADVLERAAAVLTYICAARDSLPAECRDAGEGWILADATAGVNTALTLLDSLLVDLREDAESAGDKALTG